MTAQAVALLLSALAILITTYNVLRSARSLRYVYGLVGVRHADGTVTWREDRLVPRGTAYLVPEAPGLNEYGTRMYDLGEPTLSEASLPNLYAVQAEARVAMTVARPERFVIGPLG